MERNEESEFGAGGVVAGVDGCVGDGMSEGLFEVEAGEEVGEAKFAGPGEEGKFGEKIGNDAEELAAWTI